MCVCVCVCVIIMMIIMITDLIRKGSLTAENNIRKLRCSRDDIIKKMHRNPLQKKKNTINAIIFTRKNKKIYKLGSINEPNDRRNRTVTMPISLGTQRSKLVVGAGGVSR